MAITSASSRARGCTLEQKSALPRVLGERGRALELDARFVESAELHEKIAAHARQKVIGLERPTRDDRVHDVEAACRTERHRYRDRTIQLDDGRRQEPAECLVESGNA